MKALLFCSSFIIDQSSFLPNSSMTNSALSEPPRFIVVEGPLRVGKTTLADILADRLHATRLRDVEDNPFLEGFYKEDPGASFQAQFHFLLHRFKQLRALDLMGSAN